MTIQTEIKKIIQKALKELSIEMKEIHLEHPVDLSMGDYSTNVAMVYGKKNNQNPKELAKKIAEKINLEPRVPNIKKVEVAGPGFINFHLSPKFFEESISEILKAGENYGSNNNLKGQKILVEHSSPNLFKEFHIGHMVNNAIGESITRIIKKSGAEKTTKVISYPSDVGLGIAKTIWAILNQGGEIKGNDLNQKIDFLGQAYVEGNSKYKEQEEIKKEIEKINLEIYNKSNKKVNDIYNEGKKLTLEYFETIASRLGSNFDDYLFESDAGEVGKKIVKENIGKVFEESKGAVIFNAEKFDEKLHTRVFLNSQELPTYEAKDLGLLKLKFNKFKKFGIFGFKPDKSIFITDNEQNEYMKVMLKSAEQINPEWSEKTKHIGHGRLRFPEGRLSSRDGNVLTVIGLLDDLKKEILLKMQDFDGNKKKTAEKVAVGAVKYSILKSSAGKNIVFDKEKALSLEGNSGPYLQYTYARAKSILEKAKKENIKSWLPGSQQTEVRDVEKLIYRFPEIVERAGNEYEPHYIATYLFELAQTFNSYYGNNKIVDKQDKSSSYKVALSEAVAHTIKNGLWLLGIEAPERL